MSKMNIAELKQKIKNKSSRKKRSRSRRNISKDHNSISKDMNMNGALYLKTSQIISSTMVSRKHSMNTGTRNESMDINNVTELQKSNSFAAVDAILQDYSTQQ